MSRAGKENVEGGTGRNRRSFIALSSAFLAVWLIALPWVSRRESWQQHFRWLERNEIDPGAMYYTELPLMQRLLQHKARRSYSTALESQPLESQPLQSAAPNRKPTKSTEPN